MALVDVQLTIHPDETVRIHEGDVPQLAHQGLIVGEPVAVPEAEPTAPRKPKTTKAGKPGENEGNSQP